MKLLGKILAVVSIIIAIYAFDLNSWNRTVVSIMLFLSGIHLFLYDSKNESYRKFGARLQRLAFIIAVLLLIKLIIIG